MVEPTEDAELKRREYELKRHDFLARIYDTQHAIVMKLAGLSLAGNLAAVLVLWTNLKDNRPDDILTHGRWAIGLFSLGIFLALGSLSSSFIATGSIKTVWQVAAARNFDPPYERPTADETRNRTIYNAINRSADSCLIWSSVAFTIGVVYSMWALQTFLKS